MPRLLAVIVVLALTAACSEAPPPPPPPAPVAQPGAPAEPAKPEPKAEAKAPEAPQPDPNAQLAARVKRALEDEAKIQAAAIDVTAADGKVTLWGTASTDGERARAAQVAGKVDGVKSVENKISVVRGS